MALWDKVQQLPASLMEQVQGTYGTSLPLEVRHHCAAWIEDQPWKDIDESHEHNAFLLTEKFLELVEAKIIDNTLDFHVKVGFQAYALQLKNVFLGKPMDLVHVVRKCLTNEWNLVILAENLIPGVETSKQATPDKRQEIEDTMDLLNRRTTETAENINEIKLRQDEFVAEYPKLKVLEAKLTHIQQQQQQQQPPNVQRTPMEIHLEAEKYELNRELYASAQQIFQQRQELAKKHKITLAELERLVNRVVDDELIAWQQKQKLALNDGVSDTAMINLLQKWYQSLADLIWRNGLQINRVEGLLKEVPIDAPAGTTDLNPVLLRIVDSLLTKLVKSSLIVEQQPPQVLKKRSKFPATVRLLVGGKLNLQLPPPTVKATIFSELEARRLFLNEVESPDELLGCGDMLNNALQMNYDELSGKLSVTFRTMAVEKIKRSKRSEKKGTGIHANVVAEEKFGICFSTKFKVGENEFDIWTLSLPVVVTVHVNQECDSTATIVWDNHFSQPRRIPFQVPDRVPWSEVASMLSNNFCSMTGRGLSESNLRYLGNKLCGVVDFSNAVVTWAQFFKASLRKYTSWSSGETCSLFADNPYKYKQKYMKVVVAIGCALMILLQDSDIQENLPGREFTFWAWFRSACNLVTEHFKDPWTKGYIIGFMDKFEGNDILLSRPSGTFLLRFSDSSVGAITIAWVIDKPDKSGDKETWNLEPFTSKDFEIRSLANRVKDSVALVTLYPNDIPKDTAFPSTSDETEIMTPGGYIKATLVMIQGQQPTPRVFQGPSPPQSPKQVMAPQEDSELPDLGAECLEMDTSFNLEEVNKWLSLQEFPTETTTMTTS